MTQGGPVVLGLLFFMLKVVTLDVLHFIILHHLIQLSLIAYDKTCKV